MKRKEIFAFIARLIKARKEIKESVPALKSVYDQIKLSIAEESEGGKKITINESIEINKKSYIAIEKLLIAVGEIKE